jgi:hypothetical protein
MGAARFDVVDLRAAMSLDLFSTEHAAEKVRQ